MPRAVTITGARSTESLAGEDYTRTFSEYVGVFARPDVTFYLGGARGIDSLALLWLASATQSSLVVVVPATLTAQPADARHAVTAAQEQGRLAELVELRNPSHPSPESYHVRNYWMVDHSEFVIGFPSGNNAASGTWVTLNYAAHQGKPRLILPIENL